MIKQTSGKGKKREGSSFLATPNAFYRNNLPPSLCSVLTNANREQNLPNVEGWREVRGGGAYHVRGLKGKKKKEDLEKGKA